MVSRRKSTPSTSTEKKKPASKKGKKQVPKESNQPSVANTFKVTKKKATKASEETKKKRQVNRFNGMSEEEVAKRGLPDYLKENLDVVFIGINPSMFAAYTGRYYDGPGNHFWPALHLSGFLPKPMGPQDDENMMDLGIGFTNVVPRTTRGIMDLSRKEIAEGAEVLREKLGRFRPRVACFNGKAIYQVYSNQKKFMFGKQPDPLEGTDGKTTVWVMPSSSARCAQLPRAVDKVPFFSALKRYLDFLKGLSDEPHEEEIVFANVVLKNQPKKVKKESEKKTGEDQQEENGSTEQNGSEDHHQQQPSQEQLQQIHEQQLNEQHQARLEQHHHDPAFQFSIKEEMEEA